MGRNRCIQIAAGSSGCTSCLPGTYSTSAGATSSASCTVTCLNVTVSDSRPIWTCSSGSVQRLNYLNSETMSGLIAPTGKSTVTLTFTAFITEPYFDRLTVSSCTTVACTETTILLDQYSGSSVPSPLTSSTGFMLLE
jgi:hypothetical protein